MAQPLARFASDCIDSRQPGAKILNLQALKRNTTDNSCIFCRMSYFRANEIFGVWPFIMLEIGAGWPEKFVRFFLPDC